MPRSKATYVVISPSSQVCAARRWRCRMARLQPPCDVLWRVLDVWLLRSGGDGFRCGWYRVELRQGSVGELAALPDRPLKACRAGWRHRDSMAVSFGKRPTRASFDLYLHLVPSIGGPHLGPAKRLAPIRSAVSFHRPLHDPPDRLTDQSMLCAARLQMTQIRSGKCQTSVLE